MPDEQPIACSLSATELPKRFAEIAALGDVALVDVRAEPLRAELRFAGEHVRDRLEAIVAAESSCCSFLTMELTEEPALVVLTIAAPEGAEIVLQELVGAFRGQPAAA
jgi:hypothetical protein